MGLIKSIKKAAGPVGGIVGATMDPLNMSGEGGLGGLGDLLMGKKDKGTPDSYVPLDPLQMKVLGKYNQMLDTDTDGIAQNMVTQQENQVRSMAGDTERKARDLVAQRGLGDSSVGLNAILGANRDTGEKINAVRSQLPTLQYDLKSKNLGTAAGGIQNIFANRIFKQGREGGGRTGGLMPLVGAGIGGLLGGPGGAMVGMQAGQYATQMR